MNRLTKPPPDVFQYHCCKSQGGAGPDGNYGSDRKSRRPYCVVLTYHHSSETQRIDPTLETTLSADASSYGLGAVMNQEQKDGNWKPVVFISCALNATERRYAQIEKEALTTTWACERLADYLIGKQFHLETDHKPLLGSKNLEEMSPQIQRLRMRLLRFNFTVSHVHGKSLITTDALSRAPVEQKDGESSAEEEIDLYVQHVLASLPASNTQLEQIKEKQED